MKAGELRDLALGELLQKVKETRDELFSARIRHATGQLEETSKLSALRRDIARMETVMGEKRGATK
ncbi:MAG: 50S ribosomal protein L29 [Myxococcota bacterium]